MYKVNFITEEQKLKIKNQSLIKKILKIRLKQLFLIVTIGVFLFMGASWTSKKINYIKLLTEDTTKTLEKEKDRPYQKLTDIKLENQRIVELMEENQNSLYEILEEMSTELVSTITFDEINYTDTEITIFGTSKADNDLMATKNITLFIQNVNRKNKYRNVINLVSVDGGLKKTKHFTIVIEKGGDFYED